MIRALSPLLLLGALAGCDAPGGPQPRWIAHAACGSDCTAAPNTPLAVLEALDHGVDGLEVDVQLSADDVLIAYHPPQLEEATNGTGLVDQRTWADLRRCSLTGQPGMRVPRLEDLLRMDKAGSAHWVLDVKLFASGDWVPYQDRFARALMRFVHANGLHDRVRVECRDADFLARLHRVAPALPLGLVSSGPDTAIPLAAANGHGFVVLPFGAVDRATVTTAHNLGLKVAAYGASSASALREAWSLGVDEVQTDDPAAIPRP